MIAKTIYYYYYSSNNKKKRMEKKPIAKSSLSNIFDHRMIMTHIWTNVTCAHVGLPVFCC